MPRLTEAEAWALEEEVTKKPLKVDPTNLDIIYPILNTIQILIRVIRGQKISPKKTGPCEPVLKPKKS